MDVEEIKYSKCIKVLLLSYDLSNGNDKFGFAVNIEVKYFTFSFFYICRNEYLYSYKRERDGGSFLRLEIASLPFVANFPWTDFLLSLTLSPVTFFSPSAGSFFSTVSWCFYPNSLSFFDMELLRACLTHGTSPTLDWRKELLDIWTYLFAQLLCFSHQPVGAYNFSIPAYFCVSFSISSHQYPSSQVILYLFRAPVQSIHGFYSSLAMSLYCRLVWNNETNNGHL